ncbi:hypothetical protein SNK05_006694 [Fusarium graminearum]
MSFEIYTGSWTDWSRGRVLGATLTLSSRDSSLLLAFIAAFVTVVAIRLWLIIAFTAHQLAAAGGKHDGLYYQRQVILRNVKSAPAAAWLFLQQAWHWRGIAGSSFSRTLPLALFCIIYSVGFAILAVFSSQISDSASAYRLLRSPSCGFQIPSEEYQKATFDNQRAALYSKECYSNTSSPVCNMLPTRELEWASSSVDCPFGGKVCLDTPAFKMESRMIDTHYDLGLNNPPKNRLKYKRETICSPLNTGDGFTQYINGSEADSLGWQDNVLIRYLYGGNLNDLTLMLIAPNSVINLKPNDDPVFAASIPTNAQGAVGYLPDRWIAKTLLVLWESSLFYHTIWTQTQSFLRAQEKVAGISGQPLPSNQWEIEMSALFNTTLANLQYHMMEYAAGSSVPTAVNITEPWDDPSADSGWAAAYKNMCYNQRTKETQGTLNFSILGLGLLFGLGFYIIVLSFILEFLMAWIQKWLGRGILRARRWERDATLQQMRLLYEIQGSGDWKGTTEDFPCTVSGEYFGHDEDVISSTTVEVRQAGPS